MPHTFPNEKIHTKRLRQRLFAHRDTLACVRDCVTALLVVHILCGKSVSSTCFPRNLLILIMHTAATAKAALCTAQRENELCWEYGEKKTRGHAPTHINDARFICVRVLTRIYVLFA